MVRKMNKKGMFFTLIAIALLSLFLVTYTFYSFVKSRTAIRKRIETMNTFVFGLEQDFPRQLYISGFRIIFTLEKEIIDTGDPISDLNGSVEELFYNGSLKGISRDIMLGVNLTGIQSFLDDKAAKINAEINLTNPSIMFIQEDPWGVKFYLTADLLIADKKNLVLWNKTPTTFSAYIPIENFDDPLYVLGTNGSVNNKINRTIYQPFAEVNDTTNLSLHVNSNNSYYIESIYAPSFLDRLQGKTDASPFGIESLIYIPKFTAQGLPVEDKSIVDYVYFSTSDPAIYKITNMPSWFKIDNSSNRLEMYGINHLANPA